MNNIQVFKNNEFGSIRTITLKTEPWFCLIDICNILEIKNVSDCKRRLKQDGVVTSEVIDNLGRAQQASFINESNLYKVIFQSRKAEAERFTDWVTTEVLPTIRKTGGYVNNDEMFIDTYLPYADESTKAMFKGTLETIRKQNEVIKTMKPKSDYFDSLVERNLLTNFRDTAKELKVSQKVFMNWLDGKKYIYRDSKGKPRPYAEYTPSLFELKEFVRSNGYADIQVMITPKGRETFRLLLIKDGYIKDVS